MTDDIDTWIPGSVSSVDAAANWLDDLKTGFGDADYRFVRARSSAMSCTGELFYAAMDYCADLHEASSDAEGRAGTAVDNIRSFADQLGWRKEDMSGHRTTATDGGLTVSEYLIMAPDEVEKPADLPKGATQQQKDSWYAADEAYEAYLEKKELFEELKTSVDATRKELDDWITQNLKTAEADVLNALVVPWVKELVNGSIAESPNVASNVYDGKIADHQKKLIAIAEAKATSKSANPAVRAGVKPPSQAAVDRNYGRSPKAGIASTLSKVGKYGKVVAKAANPLITVAFAAQEIASGESPGKVILSAGAGMATGIAVAAIMAGSPFIASAVAAVVISGAVAAGVGYAYENWVSKETREKIDEGLRDFGNGVKDTVKGAWNGASEGASDAKDWVEDRWKMAFG